MSCLQDFTLEKYRRKEGGNEKTGSDFPRHHSRSLDGGRSLCARPGDPVSRDDWTGGTKVSGSERGLVAVHQ